MLGREITYQSLPVERWAEVVVGASAGRPPRNDAGALYPEADRITGRACSEVLVQHLREIAIDHTNGIFAGTNEFVETIGGQPPLTVEALPSIAKPWCDVTLSHRANRSLGRGVG